ncbi:MAG: hypothetical protein ACLGQW_11940 [Acidobacteriota bacterium]
MIEHRITLGEEELRASATQNNLPILMLTKFLRSLPEDQRCFFKDCRIEAVIPFYMPRGDFKENVHAMNMDQDQLDWLLRERPEFRACDDTANNTLTTGGKVVSCGAVGTAGSDGQAKANGDSTCNEKL